MLGKRIIGIVVSGLWIIFAVLHVNASGGEEYEGSQLEKFLLEENQQEYDMNESEMNYVLFCETNTGYGVTLDYYRYGIYADFIKTEQEGEELYFKLYEKLLGRRPDIATYTEWAENIEGLTTKEITHKKWVENEEEIIVDVSTDLEWVVTRKYEMNCSGQYTERWYYRNELIKEFEGGTDHDIKQFETRRTILGNYEPIPEDIIQNVEKLLDQYYGKRACESSNKWTCLDSLGNLLAVVENDDNECGIGIDIYSIEEENIKLLYRIDNLDFEEKWPMEISQIEGSNENGWLVFSYGDETYRMTYPDGDMEKIGEFMYGTTYSPDGKYLAYCTGNILLYDYWEISSTPSFWKLMERWKEILPGWYIEELATGEKKHILMPTWELDNRPLYGGRCIWIEKSKLENVFISMMAADEIQQEKVQYRIDVHDVPAPFKDVMKQYEQFLNAENQDMNDEDVRNKLGEEWCYLYDELCGKLTYIVNNGEEKKICYSLLDLTGDGIPEMIMGFNNKPRVIYYYSKDNGVSMEFASDYYVMNLYEGGIVEYRSAGIHSTTTYMKFQSQLEKWECVERLAKLWDNEKKKYDTYYHMVREQGIPETEAYMERPITEEEYFQIKERYTTEAIELEWRQLVLPEEAVLVNNDNY